MTVVLAVVAATMIVLGLNSLLTVALALIVVWPPAGLAAFAAIAMWKMLKRGRGHPVESETSFLNAVASAVSAGSTIRDAIADSNSPFVGATARRLCMLGRPMAEVAAELERRMPSTGSELAVMLRLSETAGARVAGAMQQLADHASDIEQRKRDQRVAVAQSKFSAIVVGVVPLIAAAALVAVRGVPEPGGAIILIPMALGACMMVAGSATVLFVAHRVVA